MYDKLKILQEEGNAMSSVFLEGQSSESTEQEGVTPKSPDVCTHKMGATQDNSPVPLMKNQEYKPVSFAGVMLLDGKSPVLTLGIQNIFSGKTEYVQVRNKELTPAKLRECATENGGISTDWKDTFEVLIKDIQTCMQNNFIKVMHGHTKLGWSNGTDGFAFYHQNVISSNDQSSEYMGAVDIKPKGTLDNIVNMIKSQILSTSEWSPLEAIIAVSVASVVLPYAKEAWGKSMNNLIIHLLGNSTTGKSTSLRLHCGLASNPFNEKSGFWQNHQSSLAAMIRRIGENQGLPVSIDELSSASKKEYTDFVYAIGNGEEKDRLKAGGTALRDSAEFSTIVVSSGEVSILGKCSANTGIRVRCVEFCNVKWTDSKNQADAIYNCLRDNYGWVAPLVAKELLNNSGKWEARWNQLYDEIKRRMDEEKIRISTGLRISEYVVLFSLAAEIVNEVLSINLHVKEICDFSFRHIIVANADEANLGERAYEYLLRYVSENPEEFPDELRCESMIRSYYSNTKIKGFYRRGYSKSINGKEYRQQIVFLKNAYEEILREGGFSHKVVSHELHSTGFLLTKDDDRDTYRLTYNKHAITCYVLYCNDEEELMNEAMADGRYDPFSGEDYEG